MVGRVIVVVGDGGDGGVGGASRHGLSVVADHDELVHHHIMLEKKKKKEITEKKKKFQNETNECRCGSRTRSPVVQVSRSRRPVAAVVVPYTTKQQSVRRAPSTRRATQQRNRLGGVTARPERAVAPADGRWRSAPAIRRRRRHPFPPPTAFAPPPPSSNLHAIAPSPVPFLVPSLFVRANATYYDIIPPLYVVDAAGTANVWRESPRP